MDFGFWMLVAAAVVVACAVLAIGLVVGANVANQEEE